MPQAKFFYQSGKQTLELPDWACFCLALGEGVGRQEIREKRLVIGLSLPSRAFAAVLVGTGIVFSRVAIPVDVMDSRGYFDVLCGLPPGTQVTFADGTTRYSGSLAGVKEIQGEKRVGVCRSDRAKWSKWFNCDQATAIRVVDPDCAVQSGNRAVRPIRHRDRFLRSLLAPADPGRFALESRLECLFVGSILSIDGEVRGDRYCLETGEDGTLQEILRIRRFLLPRDDYRSDVVSGQRKVAQTATQMGHPHVVIFDGATPFLRFRPQWPSSHQVVLLARTEWAFRDAVTVLNQEYVQRVGDARLPALERIPSGIEVMMFEDRV